MPDLKSLRYKEEIQMGEARWGSVAVVCGEVLLWVDVLLLAFVYTSARDGSWFLAWWVLGQGIAGFALVVAGVLYRKRHVS